jgi:hypothetical protein
VTTAELGLITTAVVGIAAAGSPAATAWANRAHERVMLRSTRNYEQRHQTYIDVSIFLERQKALLSDVGSGTGTEATLDEIQDRSELDKLLGRLAVDGTPEVQAKFEEYAGARNMTLAALMVWVRLHKASTSIPDRQPPGITEAWHGVLGSAPPAIEALEAVQRAMRDELTEL